MSYSLATLGGRLCATSGASDSPLPPGPPGLTSMMPCCWLAGAVAGIMSSARLMCLPPGSA